ncbi:MAG TPA: biotin/lipoyl-binding protein, partial [Acetobacteraceae bacterium]|nr:biotin/lipoyl-binding protein [Acetobacteraceae bacterium]
KWWWGMSHVTSDNAQVESHIIPVLPKVGGFVAAVKVGDNQPVHAGDLLVSIDDRDYRTRLDHNNLTPRMIDATATLGNKPFSVTGGYLYTSTNPYALYGQSTIPASYFVGRREITAGFTTAYDGWSVSANAERNIQTGRFDAINAKLGWENECSAVNMIFYRRFTSFNLDKGDTVLLIQITFKTLGNVGFSAL